MLVFHRSLFFVNKMSQDLDSSQIKEENRIIFMEMESSLRESEQLAKEIQTALISGQHDHSLTNLKRLRERLAKVQELGQFEVPSSKAKRER